MHVKKIKDDVRRMLINLLRLHKTNEKYVKFTLTNEDSSLAF